MNSPPASPTPSSVSSTSVPLSPPLSSTPSLLSWSGRDSSSDDADATTTVASRLARWTKSLFEVRSFKWAPLPTHDNKIGVAIELRADVTNYIVSDRHDVPLRLQKLREAIDFLVLALAVEPSSARKVLRTFAADSEIEDDTIEAVFVGRARSELRLRFRVKGMKTQRLAQRIVGFFVRELTGQESTNEAYLALRDELMNRLRARNDEKALARIHEVLVPITMEIESGTYPTIGLLEPGDFMDNLVAFSTAAVDANISNSSVSDFPVDMYHVPVRFDAMTLSLQSFCITHRVVSAAKALMGAGLPIHLKELVLDPRRICSSARDVQDFVATISQGARELVITTGAIHADDYLNETDEQGQDRREEIRTIFRAIAVATNLRELSLMGLLTLCQHVSNRQEVWRGLFQHVLSRDSPIRLMLDNDVYITHDDSATITAEAALWRQAHSDKKLVLRDLRLHLVATNVGDLGRVLAAFDDIEGVDVNAAGSGTLPPPILHQLLSYPSLRKLTAERLVIPSMDLFCSSLSTSKLEELVLEVPIVENQSSMVRFLERLRWESPDPTGIAKTLQRFRIFQGYSDLAVAYVADEAALHALDNALKTNRVLCDVAMVTDHNADISEECLERLAKHDGRHIPTLPKARRSTIAKARNLAFLSVLRETASARDRVDSAIVNHIFDFSAPHQLRSVEIPAWQEQ